MRKKRGDFILNERLRKLRKTLDLTQQTFADRIGIARGNIGSYEVGKSNLSDAVISLICREFNVNEHWLRTGEGEMFIELTKEEEIATFIGEVLRDEDDSFKKRLVSGLSALDESDWDVLEKMVTLLKKED